jgi:hypothetical protein
VGEDQPVRWNPVTIYLGTLPYNPGARAYSIPPDIPITAKEILVYVSFRKGNNTIPAGQQQPREYRIYTQEGVTQYAQKLAAFWTHSPQWLFNSDNLWLPITTNRTIYANVDGTINGFVDSRVEILGWR